ncbi:MAG: hypothetical protein ACLQMF_06035 [Rectinemataceae bacterium]
MHTLRSGAARAELRELGIARGFSDRAGNLDKPLGIDRTGGAGGPDRAGGIDVRARR